MKIGDILKQYRTEHKITMEKFAEQAGKSKGYISMLEKGQNPRTKKPISPSLDTLQDLAIAMGIDFENLINQLDEGQSIATSTSKTTPTIEVIPSTLQKVTHTTSQLEHQRQLIVLNTAETQLDAQERSRTQQNTVGNSKDTVDEPHITYYTYDYYDQPASAGTGQYLNDVQVEQIQLPVDYKADFVVRIAGDSMKPDYHSGDYIFVKLSVDLTDGDIGVFYYEGNAYIKELRINKTGAYLHSLNPDYKDLPITTDTDFRTIGEVIGAYREE